MTVNVTNSSHLEISFDESSSWTLHIKRSEDKIELGLHWRNHEMPSNTKTLIKGSEEYNTFRGFFGATTS